MGDDTLRQSVHDRFVAVNGDHPMTPEERQKPKIIGGSRRRRIAAGSGTTPQDVNRLLKQFADAQKMMKQLKGMGLGSGRGLGLGMPGGLSFPGMK